MTAWRSYRRLYRGSARRLIVATIAATAQSLLLIPLALLIRHAFDRAVPAGDVATLAWIGLGIVGLHVASGALLLWSRALALGVTKRAVGRLREELLTKIYALPRDTTLRNDIGKTHALVVNDTERVDAMSNAVVTQLLPSIVVAVALSVFLVYLNPLLFVVVLAVLPVLMVLLRGVGRLARPRVAEFHASFRQFSRGVLFALSRLDLTKSQAAESFELGRQSRNIGELGRVSGRMALWQAAHGVTQETITSASWALILIAGGAFVAAGAMTIGDVLSFSIVALMVKRAANTMLTAVPAVIEGRASLAAVDALAGLPDEEPGGSRRVHFQGRLCFDAVAFRYGTDPLLGRVDLATEPGRLTAVAGPSGCGKTTLLYLALGFYRASEGRLTADGHDYTTLDVRHLRGSIGFVPQHPILFAGTVLENITYGSPEPDLEQARAAARAAAIDAFIEQLPEGYETLVGEGGELLSGGQRQRVAIARALYRRPRLLLLDEPTSHLDPDLARGLLNNLRRLPDAPAILLATHDEEVIELADEAYDLEGGRLVPRAVVAPAGAVA